MRYKTTTLQVRCSANATALPHTHGLKDLSRLAKLVSQHYPHEGSKGSFWQISCHSIAHTYGLKELSRLAKLVSQHCPHAWSKGSLSFSEARVTALPTRRVWRIFLVKRSSQNLFYTYPSLTVPTSDRYVCSAEQTLISASVVPHHEFEIVLKRHVLILPQTTTTAHRRKRFVS